MKKSNIILFVILLFVFLFSSCENKEELITSGQMAISETSESELFEPSKAQERANEIIIRKGIYSNKNWEESVGTISVPVVPNEDVAIHISSEIIQGIYDGLSSSYIPISIFYDEEDSIWIVSFQKSGEELLAGGDISVAIQKKDGKVLRIWFGE